MVEHETKIAELNAKLQKAEVRLAGAQNILGTIESPIFSAPGKSTPEPLRLDVEDDLKFLENLDRVGRVKLRLVERIPVAIQVIQDLSNQISQEQAGVKVAEIDEGREVEDNRPVLEIDIVKREVKIRFNGFEKEIIITDDLDWELFSYFVENPREEPVLYKTELMELSRTFAFARTPNTQYTMLRISIEKLMQNFNIEGQTPLIVEEKTGTVYTYKFDAKEITYEMELKQSDQPETDLEEEVQSALGEKIFILTEDVINRLQGRQRELAEVINELATDQEKVTWTKEQKEEFIVRRLYAYELESGIKHFNEGRDDFLDTRRELNKKLEAINVKINRENIFESDAENEYLIEVKKDSGSEEAIQPEDLEALVEPATVQDNVGAGAGVTIPFEPSAPSAKELARRERFKNASSKMKEITDKLIADSSGFYDGIGIQVFRNRAKETFGRNFDDKTINSVVNRKIIRPEIPSGKETPVLTFEEQATLAYIVLHGINFVSTDGKGFLTDVASATLKLYRQEKAKQNGGNNGHSRR
ncbi:hypothetical protein A3B39_03715 [Candidatus Daviesbacteria bacterium RIFCSPLOWO2_01_FULL_37_10]|nr:MAG: hypothetical protein A3B39_03715 [Candidatus Daviesbacteria bacterium RIFCSPLOWO2_01_FULL_37_10]